MKHKFCALLLTLLILLGSGTCQAVIVPDSTGQNPLPLSQIPDIIRHVTNRTSGDISMQKDSLMILNAEFNESDKSSYTLTAGFYDFTENGVVFNKDFSIGSSSAGTYVSYTDYMSSTFPVNISSSSNEKVVATSSVREHSDRDISALSMIAKGGYESFDVSEKRIAIPFERPVIIDGGIAVGYQRMSAKGFSGDVVLEAFRKNDDVMVTFLLNNDTYSWAPALHTYAIAACNEDNLPTMFDETAYFPASVTAGDFDNDGCDNEFALVWSDLDAVHACVEEEV